MVFATRDPTPLEFKIKLQRKALPQANTVNLMLRFSLLIKTLNTKSQPQIKTLDLTRIKKSFKTRSQILVDLGFSKLQTQHNSKPQTPKKIWV